MTVSSDRATASAPRRLRKGCASAAAVLTTCIALVRFTVPVVAADQPLGRIVAAVPHTTLDLLDDGSHSRLDVPLDYAAGVQPQMVTARVVEVAFGDRIDSQLLRAVKVSAPDAAGVSFDIDFALLNRSGAYRVVVELTNARRGAARSAQRLTLALNHPPAKVRVPAGVLLVRTLGIVRPDTLAPEAVTLFEESRKSQATVRFETVTPPAHDGIPVGATIGFENVTLPVGASAPVKPILSGDFPIGSTKATLAARASQLDDPVTFEVEVRSRRPAWLVFPIMLGSALLGWFVRIYLKRREDLMVLVAQAEAVIEQLQTERARAMAEQQAALDDAVKALDRAIDAAKDEEITTAIRDGNAALTIAQTARRKRRGDLLQLLGTDRSTLAIAWRVPVEFDLTRARAQIDDAIRLATMEDFAGAEEQRQAAVESVSALIDPGRTWGARAVRALSAAESALAGPLRGETRPLLESHLSAIAAAAQLDATLVPSVQMVLHTLHTARAAAVDYARDVAWRLDRVAVRLAEILATPDLAAGLRAAAKPTGDPEDAERLTTIESVPSVTAALIAASRTTFSDLLHGQEPDAVQQLRRETLLGAGNVIAAAQTVATQLENSAGRSQISGAVTLGLSSATPLAPPPPTPQVSLGATNAVLVVDASTATITARHVETLRRLARTRLLRGVFAALVLAAATTLLYAETFIGTATEILGLAALGFTSDFTIESALDSVLKKRG